MAKRERLMLLYVGIVDFFLIGDLKRDTQHQHATSDVGLNLWIIRKAIIKLRDYKLLCTNKYVCIKPWLFPVSLVTCQVKIKDSNPFSHNKITLNKMISCP